jgi:hypothetical protein
LNAALLAPLIWGTAFTLALAQLGLLVLAVAAALVAWRSRAAPAAAEVALQPA